MSLEVAVAVAMFAGVVSYAVLGGADFGSGFFDLTAGGAQRGAELRTLVDDSIGPVWEANHVWLIYVMVMWWTAFPESFAAAMSTLAVPMLLALLGIVLRGASFAFRKYTSTLGQARALGVVFATSSILAPFFLGTVVGAIVSGRVPADGSGNRWSSWLTITSMTCGVLAVGTCAFLAGVFLAADAHRRRLTSLTEFLRHRAIAIGVVTGVIAVGAVGPVSADAAMLGSGLRERGWWLVLLSVLTGVTTLVQLLQRRYAIARVPAVVSVVTVLVGWAVAQYPWILVGELTIDQAAGARATLQGLLIAAGLAVVLVLPPLVYLFRLTQSERWSRH